MSLAIYKPGQGYWTRVLSAVGAGVVLASGAYWLWNELVVLHTYASTKGYAFYVQAGVAGALMLLGAAVSFWIMNKPRVVDFMIATEAEMKKVNWPTRREVIGSTWVVIVGTFLMAGILYAVDLIFLALFIYIRILQGRSLFGWSG